MISEFFFKVTKYPSIPLEIIIKGIRYSRKNVAPSNSNPADVAAIEGSKYTGIDFLNPYLSEE